MRNFTMVPNEALEDPDLKPGEFKVLVALYSFRPKNTNVVFPRISTIANRTGFQKETISRMTTRLVDLGWIEKSGNRGRSRGSEYTLHIPERLTPGSIFGVDQKIDPQINRSEKVDREVNSIEQTTTTPPAAAPARAQADGGVDNSNKEESIFSDYETSTTEGHVDACVRKEPEPGLSRLEIAKVMAESARESEALGLSDEDESREEDSFVFDTSLGQCPAPSAAATGQNPGPRPPEYWLSFEKVVEAYYFGYPVEDLSEARKEYQRIIDSGCNLNEVFIQILRESLNKDKGTLYQFLTQGLDRSELEQTSDEQSKVVQINATG